MLNRIIRFSLTHRMLVLSLAAFVLVYGGWTIVNLPVDVFPDLNRPTVVILTEAGGLAPEEVEVLVSFPIEVEVNGTPGLKRLRSSSGPGLSVVFLEFGWGSDVYRNRQLVAEKLSIVKENLPPGITPVMAPISSVMGEIQFLGLSSKNPDINPMDLRTIADWTLRPRLLSISGISQVIPIGGDKKQYQIFFSSEELRKRNLSIEAIQENLSHLSHNTTGGFLIEGEKEYLVRNMGRVSTLDDIRDSVAGISLGLPVTVKEIAKVQFGPQVKRGDASIGSKPGVIMGIQKQPGASTIKLTEKISKAVEEIQKTLPKGVEINANLFKQSKFIERATKNVKEALRDGAILVTIVLFLFLLNFRTTVITLTAIPLSFVITAIIFKIFGYEINTMTLGGLAIAIGELVDDAIVDVENTFRRLRENRQLPNPKPSLQVIYEASKEIRNSIVFATVIVVLVFLPLLTMSGLEGRFFIPLGVAYVVSLIASLLVSLTVTPVLASYLLVGMKAMKENKDGLLVRMLKKWDGFVLRKFISKPKIVVLSLLGAFIMSIYLMTFLGKEFLPRFDEGTALVTVKLKPGVSLEHSFGVGRKALGMVMQVPEVEHVSLRTGRAELDEHAEGVYTNEIEVDFKEEGRPRGEVLAEIREKLTKEIPGVYVNLNQPISHRLDHMLSGVKAQIAIKIFGEDLQTLRALAARIHRAIKDTPGLVDLEIEPQVEIPQVKIRILRDEAKKYKIVVGKLTHQLQMALDGEVVAQVIEGQTIFDIFMRLDEKSRNSIEQIRKIIVKTMPDGKKVSLEDVADVYDSEGPNLIRRENMQRRIVVQANAAGRALDSIIGEIKQKIGSDVKFPKEYYLKYEGQFKNQQEASRMMAVLGLISLLGMFLVLYGHFRSVILAFQIMFNIPMAFIGSVVAVYLSGGVISVASMVAFIALCGIASRNGILMISHYLNLIYEEKESFSTDMVIRGSLERLVPVLMTALTSMLGLLPLVLSAGEPGKEILYPVAVVVVGGLFSSTLLDMWVTPTIFYNYTGKIALKKISKLREREITETITL